MQLRSLTIVGVGLVGGSVARAVRRRGFVDRIVGVDRDAAVLARARELGFLDEGQRELSFGVAHTDLVVFCTPVDVVAEQALACAHHCRPGAILTDTGSTKGAIVAELESRLPNKVFFVGGHPLAGSERHGLENADPELFRDRLVVLTPTESSNDNAVSVVAEFWRELGARVEMMAPDAHDQALALTSHLPHLVASALAGVLPAELAGLTASGFRDTTRIAASDPHLWEAIFDANREAVLEALRLFGERLDEFRAALKAHSRDAFRQLLADGQAKRNNLDRR